MSDVGGREIGIGKLGKGEFNSLEKNAGERIVENRLVHCLARYVYAKLITWAQAPSWGEISTGEVGYVRGLLLSCLASCYGVWPHGNERLPAFLYLFL